jgi:predicted RecA/RadA family phage recombinase
MMQNFIKPGEHLTLPAPHDVASGAGALSGAIFGVAQGAALIGEDVAFVRRGVFELAKASDEAWTVGVALYWDADAKLVTSVAIDNTLIGAAAAIAANPSDTGTVLLDGTIR